jgi:hypothetical protein
MFDSLEEQMLKDENRTTTSKQRMFRYALYVLAGVVIFGGLIYGVHLAG